MHQLMQNMKDIQQKKYPLTLLFVSVALLFMTVLRSKQVDEIRSIDVNDVNILYQIKGI